MNLTQQQEQIVIKLLTALVDQKRARVVVPPQNPSEGYWFGGGNLNSDENGDLWLAGRYRNYGDSRIGVGAGVRGLECAIFRSTDGGQNFEKAVSWTKADLSLPDAAVVSIEGTAMHQLPDGTWELFISFEKDIQYPEGFEGYQKPGTGVWSIDSITGPSPDRLDRSTLSTVIATDAPEYLHVKDPVVFDEGDTTTLIFCSHPISWTSSNTGLAFRRGPTSPFDIGIWQMVARGTIWDVAVTRITNRLLIPQQGVLKDIPLLAVLFYDGAECMRQLDENSRALQRPRGYSCEELGGALLAPANDLLAAKRLSRTAPLFISPYGTGSSRYVNTLVTENGIYATWQQSQKDGSQPLVMNYLPKDEVEHLTQRRGCVKLLWMK